MTDAEAAEHIYMQYQRAKMTWRRFTEKPVRKFRRAIRHAKGKGKGKGNGKNRGFFFTHDDVMVYLKGKGKTTTDQTLPANVTVVKKIPETDKETS